MKIGVISDTHNNLSNMIFGLNTFREEGIDTIIHCGDLTGLDMVDVYKRQHQDCLVHISSSVVYSL